MKKKIFFASVLILAFVNPLFSNSINLNIDSFFNEKLSDEEKNLILNNKVLIKNTGNVSNLCLKPVSQDAQKLISEIKKLKPAYLSEIITIIPYSENQNLTEKLYSILKDIPSYKGIPYYSEHNKIWVELYSSAVLLEAKKTGGQDELSARLYMEPFGDIDSKINITKKTDSIFYENTNLSDIKYNSITCVKSGNMKSFILMFRSGNYLVMYGSGAVNAPKIPGLSKRIELSFMNRIKTFCNFVFTNLK